MATALTGVFPASSKEDAETAPLELVWCADSGLTQLAHNYNPSKMYGDNYGYRSGLNKSMVRHLTNKVVALENFAKLAPGDVVVDIGSNDATTLKAYTVPGIRKIGIDPTGKKFEAYYPDDVVLSPNFFSLDAFRQIQPTGSAKIVTSIAMFYDLSDPVDFARQIASILTDDGIWHLEQSYLPAMLNSNSYDTICHEHLEYYTLSSITAILSQSDFKIVDVSQNDINGGSFAVTAVKRDNDSYRANQAVIKWMMDQECRLGLDTPKPYLDFAERAQRHRADLCRLISGLNADGRKVLGYGASTKGNVILQYCGFTTTDIPAIAEVNTDKFGRVTPGSHIPIISELDAHAMNPDYFLVLPWHFRNGILEREQTFRDRGGRLIFPFPFNEIV